MTNKTLYENFRKMINECENRIQYLIDDIDKFSEISRERDLTITESFIYKNIMVTYELYDKMLQDLNKAYITYNKIFFESL